MIALAGISKAFGDKTVLVDLSIQVPSGEAVAVLGGNGAGKSTLLRILATTVLPDNGAGTVAGYDLCRDAHRVRASVGLALPEDRSWYWRVSGRENLSFFAALVGLGRTESRARTTELLKEVGLQGAAEQRVGEYSSGMRGRLAIARALLADPPVLLLDEPTRSLDDEGSDDLAHLLQRSAERGRAVVCTTHDPRLLRELGVRTLRLEAGGLIDT